MLLPLIAMAIYAPDTYSSLIYAMRRRRHSQHTPRHAYASMLRPYTADSCFSIALRATLDGFRAFCSRQRLPPRQLLLMMPRVLPCRHAARVDVHAA